VLCRTGSQRPDFDRESFMTTGDAIRIVSCAVIPVTPFA